MPRKILLLLTAAAVLTTLVCLPLGVGVTQARYLNETAWPMLLNEPEPEGPETGLLRTGGQRVLMGELKISRQGGAMSIALDDVDGGEVQIEPDLGGLLNAEIREEPWRVTLVPTEWAFALTQREDASVRVTWIKDEDHTLWADLCFTVVPPQEDASSGRPAVPNAESVGSEGPAMLLSGWMRHFDPMGALLLQFSVPENTQTIGLTRGVGKVFPAGTRFTLRDPADPEGPAQRYMLFDDMEELKLPVDPGQAELLLELSETEPDDRDWEEETDFKLYAVGYTADGSSLLHQDVLIWADGALPRLADGAPLVSRSQSLRLNAAGCMWEDSDGCRWDADFELLTRQPDEELAYEPLEKDAFFVLTAPAGQNCLLVSIKPGVNVSPGSYRMILRLKCGDSTAYEEIIPFFVNYQ